MRSTCEQERDRREGGEAHGASARGKPEASARVVRLATGPCSRRAGGIQASLRKDLGRGGRGGARSRGGLLAGSAACGGAPLLSIHSPKCEILSGRHSAVHGAVIFLGPPRLRVPPRTPRQNHVAQRSVSGGARTSLSVRRRALPERRIAPEEELHPERLLADEDGLVEEDVGADHLGRHRPLAASR